MIHEKSMERFNQRVYDENQLRPVEDDEDDEDRIDTEMLERFKIYLLKLKAESKTNEVAARIYHKIDPNVKQILINEVNPNSQRSRSR